MFRSTLVGALSLLLCAGAAAAQTPTPAPPQLEPSTTTPQDRAFHGNFTGGLQLQSGQVDAWGVTLDGNVTRPYSSTGTFVARTNDEHARVVISDNPRVVKTENDRETAAAGVNQTFSTHGIFMERSLFLRDAVHDIYYRFEQLGGVGVRYANPSRKLEVTFVPGLSVLKEDTFLSDPFERGWQLGAGFYQQLTTQLDERWSLQDTLSYRRTLKHAENSVEAALSLTGKITKVMGLQTQYQYVREDLVPPGVDPNQQILTMGVQFQF